MTEHQIIEKFRELAVLLLQKSDENLGTEAELALSFKGGGKVLFQAD